MDVKANKWDAEPKTVRDFIKALGLYCDGSDFAGASFDTKLHCDGKEVTEVVLFTTTSCSDGAHSNKQYVHMFTGDSINVNDIADVKAAADEEERVEHLESLLRRMFVTWRRHHWMNENYFATGTLRSDSVLKTEQQFLDGFKKEMQRYGVTVSSIPTPSLADFDKAE